jgi:hypothetical protein
MPAHKRQHYLPAAYLKYFSVDQARCNRDSRIYRFDGTNQHLVPVVSQCAEDYFYSQEKASETEAFFQRGENYYCQCIDKIRLGTPLTGQDGGNLLAMIFDFYLRNAVHKNLTGKEGIEAYKLRSRIFVRKILLGRDDGEITVQDLVTHFQDNWGVYVISPRPSSIFITSDNPSIVTSLDPSNPDVGMITLPITPTHVAIAYRKHRFEVICDQANFSDGMTLNIGQIENSERCVYASRPFSVDEMEAVKRHIDGKRSSPGEVFENSWNMPVQYLPKEYHFSFMRQKPVML